jgi:hypothetical protein
MFFLFFSISSTSELPSISLLPNTSRPTGPSIPLTFTYESPTFHIRGFPSASTIPISWTHYSVLLQIGNLSSEVSPDFPAQLNNLTLSVHFTSLTPNSGVLALKISNPNPIPQEVNITIHSTINFPSNSSIWTLPNQQGFIIYSPTFALTWSISPLVSDVITTSSHTFSWQRIVVPATNFLTRSMIAKFGNFESSDISLSLTFSGDFQNLILVTGSATTTTSKTGTLILVIDDDFTLIYTILNFFDKDVFEFNFKVSDYNINKGKHSFSFYAVDFDGNVGYPETLIVKVIEQVNGSPFPTQTPAPVDVLIDVSVARASFDIYGELQNYRFPTSFSGYYAYLRVGATTREMDCGNPIALNGIVFSFYSRNISKNAALLAFKLENNGTQAQVVDVAVGCDVELDFLDTAVCTEIQPERGFVVSSEDYALSFILRDYPLVTNASTYWFGPAISRLIYLWAQTTLNSESEVDTALSFSWQRINVQPGQEYWISTIAKFGVFRPPELILSLVFPTVPVGGIFHKTPITLYGTISGAIRHPSILLVVDDLSNVFHLEFLNKITFSMSQFAIQNGRHECSFYAVDFDGTLSQPKHWTVFVITPSNSPSPSSSASSSRSPSFSPSPSPSGGINVPIRVKEEPQSFDIVGYIGDTVIKTAFYGYTAVLRINNTLAQIYGAVPKSALGVNFAVNWTYISTNAVILILFATNRNNQAQIIDISVSSDIKLNEIDSAPVRSIGNNHGITVNAEQLIFTVVTGGYPFVSNVSTFWYGYIWDLEYEKWNQTMADSYNDLDSGMAFSWQNIRISPGQTIKRSVLIKFGSFERAHIELKIVRPQGTVNVAPREVIEIHGEIKMIGLPTGNSVRLFFVMNDDISKLIEITGLYSVNSEFNVRFVPKEYSLLSGIHKLTFHAVDADGDVSPPQLLVVSLYEPTISESKIERPVFTNTRSTSGEADESGSGVSQLTLGLVIGGVALALVIGGLVFFVFCWKKKHPVDGHEKLGDASESTASYIQEEHLND